MFISHCKPRPPLPRYSGRTPGERDLSALTREVFRAEHLANLGLALPARPELLVKFHKLDGRLNRLFLRCQLKLRIPADDLFGLGERPVAYDDFPARKPDASAQRGWAQPPTANHRAGFGRLLGELSNGVHKRFGRKARPL